MRLLCASGGEDPATLQAAIFAYNRSDEYVADVLATARSYTTAEIDAPEEFRGWACRNPTADASRVEGGAGREAG